MGKSSTGVGPYGPKLKLMLSISLAVEVCGSTQVTSRLVSVATLSNL